MDFEHAPCVEELTGRLRALMGSGVEPAEAERRRVVAEGRHPEALVDGLEEKAKAEGLWNLFLPDLEEDEPGTRLSDRESAPMAEIMGRIPWSSEVFDRHAPDTGDIESLHLFATDEQRGRRLGPLLAGTIRSGVSITEPDEASSDPTNLATGIERDGDDHVADGRKWFTTGAPHPKFAFTLVMGVSDSDPDPPRHVRHSFVIAPTDTPGSRDVPIMRHHAPEGPREGAFENVRVPVANLLGEEGAGFAVAQARLGPGRIPHCRRTIGQRELAIDPMCDRALARSVFGRTLAEHADVQDRIAESGIGDRPGATADPPHELADGPGRHQGGPHARLRDQGGRGAPADARARPRHAGLGRAAGLTPDTPLSHLWAWGRALRVIEGPDEMHLRAIARAEIKKAEARRPATTRAAE